MAKRRTPGRDDAALPDPLPLSQCRLCKSLKNAEGANHLENEAMSAAAYQMAGMPDELPTHGMRRIVHCPVCGTFYEYEVETGFMEWDETLLRLSPLQVRDRMGETRYRRLLALLPAELRSRNPSARAYAATALAEDALDGGDGSRLLELLGHRSLLVRRRTVDALGKGRARPYLDRLLDRLLELLWDDDGHLRDSVQWCLGDCLKGQFPAEHGERIVGRLAAGSMNDNVVQLVKRLEAAGADLAPLLPRLIEFLDREEEYDWLRRDVAEILRGIAARGRESAAELLAAFDAVDLRRRVEKAEAVRDFAAKVARGEWEAPEEQDWPPR